MSEKKIKVLAYCDSPTCATGFGTVSRNILEALYKTGRYSIDILGINYWGDPHGFPYRVFPTGTNSEKDPYGRKKVCSMIPRMDYDILFFLQDTFILEFLPELIPHLKEHHDPFKSICYFPVDGIPKEQWIKNVSVVDHLVAYSEFGRDQAREVCPSYKGDIDIIPHGANVTDFFPMKKEEIAEFRRKYFGRHHEKFIITNLNRNQQRKDIPRTIHAFSEFRKKVPDSILYLHMAQKDQGWDLPAVCKSYGLSTTEDVVFPENFGPNQGYPTQIVNMIYNASDVVMSTTLGEGWGLSWHEAMATKTPVVMPANTAMVENITEDKGYLVKSGTNPSLFSVIPNDNEIIRPLVDTEDLIDTLIHVYNNPNEAKKKAEIANAWVVNETSWQDSIAKRWVDLFDSASTDLKANRDDKVNEEEGTKVLQTESF